MSYFKAKMHQIRIWLGLRPKPRWEAYSAPLDLLAGFKGSTSNSLRKGKRGEKRREGEDHTAWHTASSTSLEKIVPCSRVFSIMPLLEQHPSDATGYNDVAMFRRKPS